MKREPKFKTEADLCAAFIAWAAKQGWTAYAETAGWDIVMVRDGVQIGVQAKLQMNLHVMSQSIEYSWSSSGPHFRAILVPEPKAQSIATALGLATIYSTCSGFYPDLPHDRRWHSDQWWCWFPDKPVKLPEYVPDVAAGSSAPLQLTEWKVKALRLSALLERRGHVTKADFKALGVDHRRWLAPPHPWLQPKQEDEFALVGDAAHRYCKTEWMPEIAAQHPRNYAEILADFDKWAPRP